MKLHSRPIAALALVLALSARTQLQAQDVKPIAVVSISSVNELLGDANYLLGAAGQQGFGALIPLIVDPQLNGIDRTKPIGAYVTMEGIQNPLEDLPGVVLFVPVSDANAVMQTLQLALMAQIEDVAGGLKKVDLGDGAPYFLKVDGGWLFGSNKSEQLADLPEDPGTMLDGLDKSHDLAVRINVQNIPKPFRDLAVMQIKQGYEGALAGGLPPGVEGAEGLVDQGLENMESLIQDSHQITLGMGIDKAKKNTFFDMSYTAVPGSKLAQQMAASADAKTAFGGFQLPGAAVTAMSTQKVSPEDLQQAMVAVDAFREQVLAELENDPSLNDPQIRASVKEVVDIFFDVGTSTAKTGVLDTAATLLLQEQSMTFIAGVKVAAGDKLDTAVRKLVELSKDQPDFPEVKVDADQYKGIHFHTLNVPIPAGEAQLVLGDALDGVLGIGKDAVYMAFGKDALGTLKQAIDSSGDNNAKASAAMKMVVSLGAIVKFMASVQPDETLDRLAEAVETLQGSDQVNILYETIKDGVRGTLTIDEGVIELLGKAVPDPAAGGGF